MELIVQQLVLVEVLLEVLILRTRLHLQITQALIRMRQIQLYQQTLVTVLILHIPVRLQIVQTLLIALTLVIVLIHRTRVPVQITQPTVLVEVRIHHTRVHLQITQVLLQIIHQVLIARTLLIVLIPRGIQILRTRLPLLIIQVRLQIIQILVTRLPLLIIQVLTQIIQILRITQRLQIRLLEQTVPRIILTLVS